MNALQRGHLETEFLGRNSVSKTLQRLERGGFTFDLTPEGGIAYTCADAPPDQWAGPLLAEVAAHREEVMHILRARLEWAAVYDEWGEEERRGGAGAQGRRGAGEKEAVAGSVPPAPLLPRSPAPPPPRSPALLFRRRLAELAIVGCLPCYDGGPVDLGPQGHRDAAERDLQTWAEEATTDYTDYTDFKNGNSVKSVESAVASQQKENDTMGIKIQQTVNEAVPLGDYRVKITDIEATEGKFGPQLKITCEVSEGEHAGATFLTWVSAKFSPKSRLWAWTEAALGLAIPKGYVFDSDNLIGRELIASLLVRELDGGGEVNRVDRVRALR